LRHHQQEEFAATSEPASEFLLSQIEFRAAYMPDAAQAAFRTTPELISEAASAPGFDIV
jgi:hypothetical protein